MVLASSESNRTLDTGTRACKIGRILQPLCILFRFSNSFGGLLASVHVVPFVVVS